MSGENLYTKILRWGYDRVNSGVTYSEFKGFIAEMDVELGESRMSALFRELFDHMETNLTLQAIHRAMGNNEPFHLNVEATFRHLERIELEEARNGSAQALFWARVSLCAAIVVGLIQILLGLLNC